MTNWLFPPRQIIFVWGELLKWATKKKSYFLLYWLFKRNPYNGSLPSRYNWVEYGSISSATKNLYNQPWAILNCSNEHHDVGERFGGLYIHGWYMHSKAVAALSFSRLHQCTSLPRVDTSGISGLNQYPMRLLAGWANPNWTRCPSNLDLFFSQKNLRWTFKQKDKHTFFTTSVPAFKNSKEFLFNDMHPLASVWHLHHLPCRFQGTGRWLKMVK